MELRALLLISTVSWSTGFAPSTLSSQLLSPKPSPVSFLSSTSRACGAPRALRAPTNAHFLRHGGLKMSLMEQEPNFGPQWDHNAAPELKVKVPEQVSELQLRFFRCQTQLAESVETEDFRKAADLVVELEEIVQTQNQKMVESAISKGRAMFQELDDKCKRSKLQSLSFKLDRATAEENFVKADAISRQIAELETDSEAVQAAGAATEAAQQFGVVVEAGAEAGAEVDGGMLEQELAFHVQKARMMEQLTAKDPVQKHERDLRRAVNEENYEEAAQALEQLRPLYEKRDLHRMEKSLQRQLEQERAAVEKLRANPVAKLQYDFTDALNAEDYEVAAKLSLQLQQQEAKLMFRALKQQLAERKQGPTEPTFAELEEALEAAVEADDFELAQDLQELMRAADECYALELDLEGAVARGDQKQEEQLRAQLVAKYSERLNKQLLGDLGFEVAPPQFQVGQVVVDRASGVRGVVVGWHEQCEAEESWLPAEGVKKAQNFYHILPDARQVSLSEDKGAKQFIGQLGAPFLMGLGDQISPRVVTTYAAEEQLELFDAGAAAEAPAKGLFGAECPVEHYALPHMFKGFEDGAFTEGKGMGKLMFYRRQGVQTQLNSLHQERI